MEDWFGETPIEIQDVSPSHFSDWRYICNFCHKESAILYRGKYLCIDHAEEIMMEIFENE